MGTLLSILTTMATSTTANQVKVSMEVTISGKCYATGAWLLRISKIFTYTWPSSKQKAISLYESQNILFTLNSLFLALHRIIVLTFMSLYTYKTICFALWTAYILTIWRYITQGSTEFWCWVEDDIWSFIWGRCCCFLIILRLFFNTSNHLSNLVCERQRDYSNNILLISGYVHVSKWTNLMSSLSYFLLSLHLCSLSN